MPYKAKLRVVTAFIGLAMLIAVNILMPRGAQEEYIFDAPAPLSGQISGISNIPVVNDEEEISALVVHFGSKLKVVPAHSPGEILNKAISDNYGDYAAPELLAEWLSNPQKVPGCLVSSPWPDRIEVLGMDKLSDAVYSVRGEIIEMTGEEPANGVVASKRAITLTVGKIEGSWLITDFEFDPYPE